MPNLFVMLGDKDADIVVSVTDDKELIVWAKNKDSLYDSTVYPSQSAALAAAIEVLTEKYQIFGAYEHSVSGLRDFLADAETVGEYTHLRALEAAENFASLARRYVVQSLTKAQRRVIQRIPFPRADDKHGFQMYMDDISEIRGKSVSGLREYVENGDETPDC